ncbi:Predicted CRISPR-associated helicase (fragment) [Candidatus Accumulibacter aalborgensis]|uniref:Predicted CRISPR-associated helicase n=2 Tax=Candidatus Accumulibacter aalborgensis TaxID=1860102 RepID=A0A1A8XFH4_9PROT
MHQMGNSVLIFDEVQTLPIKCVHLFNNAINFLVEQCNSTVVLCTATQPLLHDVSAKNGAIRLAPQNEIVRDVRQLFADLKRVEICDRRKPGGWAYAEIAQLALDELDRAGSCLVIVNTKDAARQVFEGCTARSGSDSVFHLSTDMCAAHRKQELKKIRDRLDAALATLCVSTQLIEAGVDVDFGAVIRSMAGLDSIAQAAGRCNRNGRPEPGIVHLVNPADERLEKLPDIRIGREHALRVLDDFGENPDRYLGNLLGPEALKDYYRYYFFNRQSDMIYPVSANQLGHDDDLLNLLSGNRTAREECQRKTGKVAERLLNQSFMAAAKVFKAIDAPTQGVIVPYGEKGSDLVARLHAAYDLTLEYDLLRTAQQYTVNVFPYVLEKLKQMEAVREVNEGMRVFSLDSRYYSKEFGLAAEPVSLMETLNV